MALIYDSFLGKVRETDSETVIITGPKKLGTNPPEIANSTQVKINVAVANGFSVLWSVLGEEDDTVQSFTLNDLSIIPTIDNIDLVLAGGTFAMADESAAVNAENITLVDASVHDFVVADETIADTVDNVTIQLNGTFLVADSVSVSAADNIVLTQGGGTFAIIDGTSSVSEDNLTLIAGGNADVSTFESGDSNGWTGFVVGGHTPDGTVLGNITFDHYAGTHALALGGGLESGTYYDGYMTKTLTLATGSMTYWAKDNGDGGSHQVYVDSTLVKDWQTNSGSWTQYTISITQTGSHVVKFYVNYGATGAVRLDDISIPIA